MCKINVLSRWVYSKYILFFVQNHPNGVKIIDLKIYG